MVDNGHYYYYYFIVGMAVAFFGIMGVMNLWQPENRLRKILGGILVFWMVQHIVSVCFISDIGLITQLPTRDVFFAVPPSGAESRAFTRLGMMV